jgi:hypothetical protein
LTNLLSANISPSTFGTVFKFYHIILQNAVGYEYINYSIC